MSVFKQLGVAAGFRKSAEPEQRPGPAGKAADGASPQLRG